MFIINQISSIVKKVYKYFVTFLSIFLVCLFYVLYFVITYYTLFVLIKYYRLKFKSIVLDVCLIITLIWLGFNIIFNHYMCVKTDPGTSFNNFDYSLLQVQRLCRKCNHRKPIRSHHCSVCGKCIFQMDHHCPWLYNCIGHFNRRYFVNFLTYITVTLGFLFLLNHELYIKLNKEYVISVHLLLGTFGLVVGGFCLFHWYILFIGKTTIELFSEDDFLKYFTFKQRLEVVFGTTSFWQALLPRVDDLNYDGIIWKVQEDQQYELQNTSIPV